MEMLSSFLLGAYLLCGFGVSATIGTFRLTQREYAIGAACVALAVLHLAGLIIFIKVGT